MSAFTIHSEAACREHVERSLWDAANELGTLAHNTPREPIERPEIVTARVYQLNDALWPPCEQCGRGVSKCECDAIGEGL